MADRRIVAAMARRTGRPRAEMERALDALLAVLRERLRTDGEVRIHAFGKFRIAETGRRIGQDFQTGERIQVASRQVVRFDAAETVLTGPRSPWAWNRNG